MERRQTFNVSVSNGNIKCPIEKSIFTINLPLEHFHATVANADTGSAKSHHTLLNTYLDHVLAKFEPSRMVRIAQNFELFDTEPSLLTTILDRVLTPFCKTFLYLKQLFNSLTVNVQTTIFQCYKIFVSPARVNRLKVATNMADLTSIKYSISSLKRVS